MADGTITARFAIDVEQGRQSLGSLGPLAQQVGQQMAGAAGDASAAVDKQLAKYQRLGEQFQFMSRQQASQGAFNEQVAPGLAREAPSASASAGVFEDAAREQEAAARASEQLTQRSNALRAVLDPLFAAELRRNLELKEANSLLAAGAISETTHAGAVARSQAAYEHAEAAATKHGKAIGLNTMQVAEFGHVGRAVIDSLAAGASPMQVLAFEGSRVAQALGEGQGGVGGSLKALGGLAAEWAPVIAGVAILGALTFAAYEYAKAQGQAQAAVEGFGRASGASAEQVMAIADAARNAGEGSAAAARTAETALLNTGKVAVDALKPATDATLAFAKATHQDAGAAAQALAGVFSNPGEEAGKLNEKLGFLDQTTLKYIERLDEQGNRTQAQIVLAEQLKASLDATAHHLDGLAGAWQRAGAMAADYDAKAGKALLAAFGFETRTRDEEIKDLRHRLEAPHAQGDVLADGSILTSSDAQAAARLRQLLAEQRSSASAQQQAATRQASQEAADRYNALVPNDDKRAKLNAGRTAAKTDLDAHRISQTQYDAETKAIDKQVAALDKSKEHHDRHAESLARDSASMEANAAGALASAEAYLQSTQKGQDADAQRQAATTATKRGADLAKAAEQQLALSVAQGAESGAKAVASLRDQTEARSQANDALQGGRALASDADRDLRNELLLRPLVVLQTRAHGEALRVITATLGAYRAALEAANDEDDRSAQLKARQASQLQIGAIAAQARIAALGPNDPRRGVAIRGAALQEGIGQGLTGGALTEHADQAVDKDRAQAEADTSTYAATTTRELDKQRVLLQAQIAMAGVSAGQRALLLADLQKRQELDEHHVDASSEAGQQILAETRNQELLNQALARASAGYDEIRGQGERLLDVTGTMFADMDKGWAGMADTALSALKEIESELFKLALINPWKNSLFGENNPTLDSVGGFGGFFGSLFGGGGGFQDPTNSDPFLGSVLSSIPGHAQGTDNAPDGYSWVGEKGPELERLPRGTQIVPHERAMAMAHTAAASVPATVSAAPSQAGHVVQVYDFRSGATAPARVKSQGNTTTVSLYDTAKKGMDSYVKGGDFERAARSTASNVTKRA